MILWCFMVVRSGEWGSCFNIHPVAELGEWRDGKDTDGRMYTITATISGAHGVVATATTIVLVPHDQGH
jgi:hypothetical protein